jgi:hypothetical protein
LRCCRRSVLGRRASGAACDAARLADALLKTFKAHHRRFRREDPEATPDAFFNRHRMVVHHARLDPGVRRPLPRIVTAEGDEMIFTRVVSDVRDNAAPGRP